MKTRTKIKLYRFFGIKRCKKEKYPDKPSIFKNRRVHHTVKPDCWLESSKIFVCQDGTMIPYGAEIRENFKNTAEALDKLAQDTIKGSTIEDEAL